MSIKECLQTACDTTETNMDVTETNLVSIRGDEESLVGDDKDTYINSLVNIPDYQGVYLGGTAYSEGDIVAWSGVLYIALDDSTNQTPSSSPTYWGEYKTTIAPPMARGNIENTVFEAPLKNSLTLVSGKGNIDFDRNSTATYKDKDGYIKYAEIDEPRFEVDGLLMESQNTNYVGYSEDIDEWTQTRCTVTSDAILSPDGVSMADMMVCDDTPNETHYLRINPEGTFPLYSAYRAFSVFVKYGGARYTALSFVSEDGTQYTAWFDLLDGNISKQHASLDYASIEEFADGWYRCSITYTFGSGTYVSSGQARVFISEFEDDTTHQSDMGGAGVYVWGGQIEVLEFASSYIPTTGSSVTRVRDMCKTTQENHPSIANGDAFSIICDVKLLYAGEMARGRSIINLGFGVVGVQDYSLLRVSNTSTHMAYYRSGTPLYFMQTLTTDKIRIGVTVDSDELVSTFVNGDITESDTHSLADEGTTFATYINIGSRYYNAEQSLYGHISNVKLYDKALSKYEMKLG